MLSASRLVRQWGIYWLIKKKKKRKRKERKKEEEHYIDLHIVCASVCVTAVGLHASFRARKCLSISICNAILSISICNAIQLPSQYNTRTHAMCTRVRTHTYANTHTKAQIHSNIKVSLFIRCFVWLVGCCFSYCLCSSSFFFFFFFLLTLCFYCRLCSHFQLYTFLILQRYSHSNVQVISKTYVYQAVKIIIQTQKWFYMRCFKICFCHIFSIDAHH